MSRLTRPIRCLPPTKPPGGPRQRDRFGGLPRGSGRSRIVLGTDDPVPRLALVSGPRFVSRTIASLRAVALQVHFERGVVAEPPLAPRVVVGSGSGAKFFRCEDV